jgi:multicomponent Na+:H+ antiporter subunit G
MSVTNGLAIGLMLLGTGFFIAGTAGLLRFPDVYTRLHALTKADNLGLGLIVVGLSLQATSWLAVLQLLLIWGLVLITGATSCYAVANAAMRLGVRPWTR